MGGNPPGMWRVGSRGGSPGRCQALNRAVRPAAGSLPRQPPRRRPPPRYRDMSWGCDASVFRARLLGGPPEPGMAPRGAHRELPKAIGPLMAPFPHLLPHFPLYFPISPFFSPFPPPIPSHELLRSLRVPGGHPGAASPGVLPLGGSLGVQPAGGRPALTGPAWGGRRPGGASARRRFARPLFPPGGRILFRGAAGRPGSAAPGVAKLGGALPASRTRSPAEAGWRAEAQKSELCVFSGGFCPKRSLVLAQNGVSRAFSPGKSKGEWRQELPRALLGVLGCLSSPWGKKQQLKIKFGVGSVKKGVKQR